MGRLNLCVRVAEEGKIELCIVFGKIKKNFFYGEGFDETESILGHSKFETMDSPKRSNKAYAHLFKQN